MSAPSTPIGVQQQRSKGWRMPPHTRSVARPSRWGNPYKPGPGFVSDHVRIPAMTAEDCVSAYRDHIEQALRSWPSMKAELRGLTGWNLACWCPIGASCHRDVLLELANGPLVCEAA